MHVRMFTNHQLEFYSVQVSVLCVYRLTAYGLVTMFSSRNFAAEVAKCVTVLLVRVCGTYLML